MNDLATVAQFLDLCLYRRIHRINAKVDNLPQVLPLKVIIILCAGFGTLDDAPPITYFLCGTGWHVTTTSICGCLSGHGRCWAFLCCGGTLSPGARPLITLGSPWKKTDSALAH